jgi:Protein of unknown function (DUF642)
MTEVVPSPSYHNDVRGIRYMNTLKNRIWVPVVLSALVSGGAGAANLVANGDFDNIGGVWVNNTGLGSDDLQTRGATDIPDWTNVPGAVNEFWVGASNDYNLSAAPGNGSQYFVDLTGQANNKPYGGLEQVIATTPGAKYTLTFDLGASTEWNSSGLAAAALTASAGGTSQLYTLVPAKLNQWAAETLSFTATGATTNIEFLADSAFTSRYVGLDNVSVQQVQSSSVPELDPASAASALALLLGGMAILCGRRVVKPDR